MSGIAWRARVSRFTCWSAAPCKGREQGVDQTLQTAMLRDAFDYNGNPGIVVLLTGDGAGFEFRRRLHADLERMHGRNWRIEVISWRHSCNTRMRNWAERNGSFIALDELLRKRNVPGASRARPAGCCPSLCHSNRSQQAAMSRRSVAAARAGEWTSASCSSCPSPRPSRRPCSVNSPA